MRRKLFLDTETYSEVPIECGVHRYAENAELMLFAWAFEGERAKVIDLTSGETFPEEVTAAFRDPEVELWAHNSHFDRTILGAFGRFPEIAAPDRWRDTMVLAYLHSLPGSLGALSEILGLPQDKAKDKDGHRLVLLFSKPQPAFRKIRRRTKATDPEDWAHFKEYCRLDVEALQEVYERLPKWNDTAAIWRQWIVDQRINDRGMRIDLDLCDAAVAASKACKDEADRSLSKHTAGAVDSVGKSAALRSFIFTEYGIDLPDMQKATLERALSDDEMPEPVKRLINLRLESSKTSVKKFDALKRGASFDGRLRGCLQFAGATRTARWTGKLFQPQNLPRGTRKPAEVETAIEALKAGVADIVSDSVMQLISDCVRGAVIAGKGRKLVVADFSNIEGRVLAWLAGEKWKIEAFEAYDEGRGPDLYKATYGRTFGVKPEEVSKHQRQIGKVLELAMGYQGGVGAFVTFARGYGVDLDELAVHTRESISSEYWNAAAEAYDPAMNTHGLKHDTYVALDAIKMAWRAARPAITKFWRDVDEACKQAVCFGTPSTVGRIGFDCAKGTLRLRLPSGRFMCYPAARRPAMDERATFVYAGIDQYSRKWTAIRTYGGKVVENITQATARDILAAAMVRADRFYPIVFSVHDELITECPADDAHTVDGLAALMCTHPAWAEGLPLAAAGFDANRYKKD